MRFAYWILVSLILFLTPEQDLFAPELPRLEQLP
jgi:hypothetical protein